MTTLIFWFHVYSDKIDQILDDAENTESMVNQILYRTFTYQKCHDKASLPTGAEVTIPFKSWLLETWSEWGKAETRKKSTTNWVKKKNTCKSTGLNHVRDNTCLPSESALGMHFYLINSFVSANDEEYVRLLVNQWSRKMLLFCIVLIVTFSRKMTERKGASFEFWWLFLDGS